MILIDFLYQLLLEILTALGIEVISKHARKKRRRRTRPNSRLSGIHKITTEKKGKP